MILKLYICEMKLSKYKGEYHLFHYNGKLGLHGLENAFFKVYYGGYIGYHYKRTKKGFWLEL